MLRKQDPLSNLMMFEALSSIFESLFQIPDSIKILEDDDYRQTTSNPQEIIDFLKISLPAFAVVKKHFSNSNKLILYSAYSIMSLSWLYRALYPHIENFSSKKELIQTISEVEEIALKTLKERKIVRDKRNSMVKSLRLYEELTEIEEAEETQLASSQIEIFDIKRVSMMEGQGSNKKLIWGAGIQHDYDNTNYREMKEFLKEAEFTELNLSDIFLLDTQSSLLSFHKHIDLFKDKKFGGIGLIITDGIIDTQLSDYLAVRRVFVLYCISYKSMLAVSKALELPIRSLNYNQEIKDPAVGKCKLLVSLGLVRDQEFSVKIREVKNTDLKINLLFEVQKSNEVVQKNKASLIALNISPTEIALYSKKYRLTHDLELLKSVISSKKLIQNDFEEVLSLQLLACSKKLNESDPAKALIYSSVADVLKLVGQYPIQANFGDESFPSNKSEFFEGYSAKKVALLKIFRTLKEIFLVSNDVLIHNS